MDLFEYFGGLSDKIESVFFSGEQSEQQRAHGGRQGLMSCLHDLRLFFMLWPLWPEKLEKLPLFLRERIFSGFLLSKIGPL